MTEEENNDAAFDALTADIATPAATNIAVEMHVDMLAFIDAGFTRQEAFTIVSMRESERINYLYTIAFHNEANGHGGIEEE